jgi:hypothetical protein
MERHHDANPIAEEGARQYDGNAEANVDGRASGCSYREALEAVLIVGHFIHRVLCRGC